MIFQLEPLLCSLMLTYYKSYYVMIILLKNITLLVFCLWHLTNFFIYLMKLRNCYHVKKLTLHDSELKYCYGYLLVSTWCRVAINHDNKVYYHNFFCLFAENGNIKMLCSSKLSSICLRHNRIIISQLYQVTASN